jgi:hypothetical protein
LAAGIACRRHVFVRYGIRTMREIERERFAPRSVLAHDAVPSMPCVRDGLSILRRVPVMMGSNGADEWDPLSGSSRIFVAVEHLQAFAGRLEKAVNRLRIELRELFADA